MTNLLEIKQSVTICTKCDLYKTRTCAVPGQGSKSDIMFVGEAPGRNEDAQGVPFVGAAGKRLDEALANAGIQRDSIYITNVVKCRPPNNRVPNTTERDMCSAYLNDEIAIVEPKIICILGNTAFGSILGGSEITKYRGKIVKSREQLYFLTIHPAATIYNQSLIDVLNSDITKLVNIVARLKKGNKIKPDIDL